MVQPEMYEPIPNWLQGDEYGQSGILGLAQRALELRNGALPEKHNGLRVASIFLNPSLRTKTSMEFAVGALGGTMVSLAPGNSSWGWESQPNAIMNGNKAEHLQDAIGVLSEMSHLIAVRAFASLSDKAADASDSVLSEVVRHSTKPVINLESALWHPLQGLADTATWVSHFGEDLRSTPITVTWAPHPKALPTAVANQVLLSAALQGMDITLAHPEPFSLAPFVMEKVENMATLHGGRLRVSHNQNEALQGARIVVAKSWSGWNGYDDRKTEAKQRETYRSWMIDQEKMALTNHAGFMHCLPVRRNVVVTDQVMDSPTSWTQETAGLRMWTAIALLEKMLGK